jgi:hypothetical protein
MERKTLIEHIEQEISGKAVRTLEKNCEKLIASLLRKKYFLFFGLVREREHD